MLDDGTLAGSSLTMDRAFRTIVNRFGRSVIGCGDDVRDDAGARAGADGFGAIEEGAVADLVVLDRQFRVVHTFIEGSRPLRSDPGDAP